VSRLILPAGAALLASLAAPALGQQPGLIRAAPAAEGPPSEEAPARREATQVFCVASVIAMRARGWILPTLAYAAATVVAFDRVNDRAHFASDVFAGAVFGTAVGRFLVSRHRAEEKPGAPEASLRIIPIRGGLAARLEF
jgi:membrane-associated phospholipid phosphatase